MLVYFFSLVDFKKAILEESCKINFLISELKVWVILNIYFDIKVKRINMNFIYIGINKICTFPFKFI